MKLLEHLREQLNSINMSALANLTAQATNTAFSHSIQQQQASSSSQLLPSPVIGNHYPSALTNIILFKDQLTSLMGQIQNQVLASLRSSGLLKEPELNPVIQEFSAGELNFNLH